MNRKHEALAWCCVAAVGVVMLQSVLKKEAAIAGLSALELALLTAAASAWITRTNLMR